MILRQLDNDLIDPYKLDEVLDAVDDYLASYKQPNFYYDTSMYDKFSLFSGIPKSVSDSEPVESEETDSILVARDPIPCFLERKNEFFRRFSRSLPSHSRGFRRPFQERNARQLGQFFEFHPRDSIHPRGSRRSGYSSYSSYLGYLGYSSYSSYPGYSSYPDYSRQLGVEK